MFRYLNGTEKVYVEEGITSLKLLLLMQMER